MAAPVNTVPPAITGTPMVGELLIGTDGTWTGGVQSFAFQWYRVNSNVSLIAGATQQTYIVVAEDVGYEIRLGVTATNNTGSSVAFSADTATVVGDFFIPEDGSGLPDANSLCSLEDAAKYHAYRNNASWGQLDSGERKAALIRATDYMQQVYRLRWSGTRTTGTQALDWPRAFVLRDDYQYQGLNGTTFIGGNFYFPADEVPLEIKNACAELALKSLSGDLAPDLGQRVLREKVDVLEVQYDQFSPQFTQYRAVDNLVAPFLSKRGNTSKSLVRT